MKLIGFAVLAALAASTAAADGPAPFQPLDITTNAAPAPYNWGGFYLGAAYAFGADSIDAYQNDVFSSTSAYEGDSIGGIAGYNVQSGRLVFGGELGYTAGPVTSTITDNNFTNYIDLKGRVGFAMDRVLVYGVVGYGFAARMQSGADTTTPASGLLFGAGVDVALGERAFIGAEYLMRNLDGEYDQDDFPGWRYENDSSSINVRVGLRF